MSNKTINSLFFPGVLIIVSLIFCWPFFQAGFFDSDDGVWAVVRLEEMVREIKDLQIPPRWSDFLNHGYGYPLFSFTYPFPYYLGAILKLVGFSAVVSIKMLFISSVILSGIIMYIFLKKLLDSKRALIGTLFYITSPWRLIDLYDRGSLGESLSFILFPLLFHLTLSLYKKVNSFKSFFLSLGMAILFLTHNVMALFFIPTLLLFIFYLLYKSSISKRQKILPIFIKSIIIGILLPAYFVLPAIIEKKYILLSIEGLANIKNYFLTLPDFISNLSFPIILVILISIISYIRKILLLKFPQSLLYFYSLLLFLITAFLTQASSFTVWQLPPLNSIDFPFRIMSLNIFFASIIASFIPNHKPILFFCHLFLILNIFYNFRFTYPKSDFYIREDSFYFTNDATTTSKDELTPVWVRLKPTNRYKEKVEIDSTQANISDLSYNSRQIRFRIYALQPGTAKINTIYFPGWKFTINGLELPISYKNTNGLISFVISQGDSLIEGKFKETNIRLLSDAISLLTFFYLLYSLYVRKI